MSSQLNKEEEGEVGADVVTEERGESCTSRNNQKRAQNTVFRTQRRGKRKRRLSKFLVDPELQLH